jgi:hypothetical protein
MPKIWGAKYALEVGMSVSIWVRFHSDCEHVQCCHSSTLLTEEKTKSKYEAVSVRRFQELRPLETFASFQLLRYSGLHLFELGLDFGSCAKVSEKWMHTNREDIVVPSSALCHFKFS